jgi:hypothetical protein
MTTFVGAAAVIGLAGCTATGGIDPAAVAAALKGLCGIAVPLATITSIINAAAGATVQSVVDTICSGFHSALAAQTQAGLLKGPLKSGTEVNIVVTVGGRQIPVTCTVL